MMFMIELLGKMIYLSHELSLEKLLLEIFGKNLHLRILVGWLGFMPYQPL